MFWLFDIDSKFWLHDCSDWLYYIYHDFVLTMFGISNLLGLLVDSFLLMFSENLIEEDEKLVRSDSEREDLEWDKRDDYKL